MYSAFHKWIVDLGRVTSIDLPVVPYAFRCRAGETMDSSSECDPEHGPLAPLCKD